MDDRALARIIWDYLFLKMPLEKADVLIVLGSIDERVAEYGANLWHEGFAPIALFSGTGSGHKGDLLEKDLDGKTEAEYFANIARTKGVPENAILIENRSENTGENAQFSFQKLQGEGISPKRILVVTKPYMTRRAFATFKKQWPERTTEIAMAAPPISFDEYFTKEQPFQKIVTIMLGDLQRIEEYPKLGFQIPQDIPQKVRDAAQELAVHGYRGHEIKN